MKLTMSTPPTLSICVPVYNEVENLPLLHEAIAKVFDASNIDGEIILVDDGSKDGSWEAIEKAVAKDARVRGLKFKQNCGETAASDAGLRAARGTYVMTMDADLQNDPKDIPAFLYKQAGARPRLRLRHPCRQPRKRGQFHPRGIQSHRQLGPQQAKQREHQRRRLHLYQRLSALSANASPGSNSTAACIASSRHY